MAGAAQGNGSPHLDGSVDLMEKYLHFPEDDPQSEQDTAMPNFQPNFTSNSISTLPPPYLHLAGTALDFGMQGDLLDQVQGL